MISQSVSQPADNLEEDRYAIIRSLYARFLSDTKIRQPLEEDYGMKISNLKTLMGQTLESIRMGD